MVLDKAAALRDIDAVLAEQPAPGTTGNAATAMLNGLYLACITRYAPPNSPAIRQADSVLADGHTAMRTGRSIEYLKGILLAIRSDIAGDRLRTFAELVHASLFDDLLGAAEHFVEQGYLLPAAVMAGGTLEEHLRQLAAKHGVQTTVTKGNRTKPKEAAALNDELLGAGAFPKPQHALNLGWIHIRNQAAHNNPEFLRVPESQVTAMIADVRAFIARQPA